MRSKRSNAAERQQIGEELRQSGELVRLLLNSTGEGIYGIDLDGNCTFANPACLKLLGFESDAELLGRQMHELVHHTRANGDPYPVKECRIYQAFRKGEGTHVDDEVMFRSDGSSFPAEYWSYPLERDGELMGCVLTFVDITARRRDEQLLAEVARFPDMNPGPVLRLDLDANVLLANAAARDVFGTELVGRCWRDVCPGVDKPTWGRIVDAAEPFPLDARVGDCEYVFTHRRDFKGHLVFVFGANVTHQKQAERALRQSEKMATLGTLAAGVAHELNNPAAATRRAAEQLRDAFARLEESHLRLDTVTLTTPGQDLLRSLEQQMRDRAMAPSDLGALERSDREAAVEEWLDHHGIADPWDLAPSLVGLGLDPAALTQLAAVLDGEALPAVLAWAARAFPVYTLFYEIGQGSARISEIVGALKSYSYLGQAPVQNVDVHEGLDNTLVILRNKLKRGITVHRDYGAAVPPVLAYGSELNQVWTNLLDNAADSMGSKGEITIRTRGEEDWAVIEIEDNGPGIPEEMQARIFDPFFTTKAPGKGTGLGLSTSYGIVTEKHKGEIRVESRPGFTRFTVKLPIEQPSAVATATDDKGPIPQLP